MYLRQILATKSMPPRFERELRTLAQSLYGLLSGDLLLVADTLINRFKACELAAEQGWDIAEHLELIPGSDGHLATESELRRAQESWAHRRRFEASLHEPRGGKGSGSRHPPGGEAAPSGKGQARRGSGAHQRAAR